MSVKILLTKENDASEREELIFHKEIISIGRDSTNDLQLSSQLASRHHAKIERNGTAFALRDLKSTNSTFINGRKLAPQESVVLKEKDRIKIGDHVLQIVALGDELEKIAEAKRVEPPKEMKREPVEVVQEPEEKVERDVVEVVNENDDNVVHDLTEKLKLFEFRCSSLLQENERLRNEMAEFARQQKQPLQHRTIEVGANQTHAFDALLETLLSFFLKLWSGYSSFQSEFLERTIVGNKEFLRLQSASTEEILKFLADPSLSEGERRERQRSLRKATEEIIVHVLGLLDGYRNSIDGGVSKILQTMSLATLAAEASKTAVKFGSVEAPLRYVPLFVALKTKALFEQKHRELSKEDRGVLEKRYFRPGFIQGYLDCVQSARSES